MKKGIKLLLSAAFALSIVGCAGNSSSDENNQSRGNSNTTCRNLK